MENDVSSNGCYDNGHHELLCNGVLDNDVDADVSMFDASLLEKIEFDKNHVAKFKHGTSPQKPGSNLKMRPLRKSDYDFGYIDLMRQLTKCGDISRDLWNSQFDKMIQCKNTFYVIVLEDLKTNQVIGSSTLHVEWKFIHQCQSRGRVEDVVVNKDYRGQQLGKLLVETATLLGKYLGCYKLSLDCEDQRVPFYAQFGFAKEDGQNLMLMRLKD